MVETSPTNEFVKQNIQDLIEIANIDISCDLPDPDVHPQGIDSFVVAFDRVPHSINAGETRIFPRYLADHIAKHMADHILTKSKKLVRDATRPKILEEIYRGVKESYSAPKLETQGEIVAKQVQEANVPPPPVNSVSSGELGVTVTKVLFSVYDTAAGTNTCAPAGALLTLLSPGWKYRSTCTLAGVTGTLKAP